LKTPAEVGEPSIVDAKEVLILRRQSDQSWKVHRLIGNTNMPSVPWHAGKGATNDEADIAAIRALLEHNESVISSEDLDGWIGQFTDDAIFMLPDKKVLIGREAGRESIRQWFEQFDMEAAISIDEIEVFGDQALVRWSVKFQSTPTSGDEPTSRDVKEIWILQRQHDGSWKCSHIIYNYDSPPPTPTLMEK